MYAGCIDGDFVEHVAYREIARLQHKEERRLRFAQRSKEQERMLGAASSAAGAGDASVALSSAISLAIMCTRKEGME